MDELLSVFLTWQFIIFCLGIASVTFILRKILEFLVLNNPKLPGNRNGRVWRELILPVAPVLFGAFAGFLVTNYPYPEGLSPSGYGRVSFGLVAGLLSGLAYRVITGLLRAKTEQINIPAMPPYLGSNAQTTMPVVPSPGGIPAAQEVPTMLAVPVPLAGETPQVVAIPIPPEVPIAPVSAIIKPVDGDAIPVVMPVQGQVPIPEDSKKT